MKQSRLLVAILLCVGPAAVASHTPASPEFPSAVPLRNHPGGPTVSGVPANWDVLRESDPETIRESICEALRGADHAPERHPDFDPGHILSELQKQGICKEAAS